MSLEINKDNIENSQQHISAQLSLILNSDLFQRSHRLSRLLEYLVTETLEGRKERIKAISIAMDIYGRDESFDQQTDTIVRVEAGRLRKLLKSYYHEQGINDAIIIEIPKGHYRPVFTANPNTVNPPSTDAVEKQKTSPFNNKVLYPLVVATIAALLLSLVAIVKSGSNPQENPNRHYQRGSSENTVTAPYIAVLPFIPRSTDTETRQLAFGLTEAMITKLSKLSGLSVMAHSSILNADQVNDVSKIRDSYGATHLVRGSLVRHEQNIIVNVQLVDTASAKTLWAQNLTRTFDDLMGLEEKLTLSIASKLSVHIKPGENDRLASSHTSNPEALVLYRQALIMLMPPNDRARVKAARELFRRTQQLDPGFAGGYAGESMSYSVTALFITTDTPETALKRALELADQGIGVDPQFGSSYAMKALAQILSGQTEEAVLSAKQSIEIQPGDAFTQFVAGMTLLIADRPIEAIDYLQEAMRLDPLEIRAPYLNVLSIAYYAAGQYQQALDNLEANIERGGPTGPHMDVFFIATYKQLGMSIKADQLWDKTRRTYPEFPDTEWLAMWIKNPALLEQTVEFIH